jgi:phosphoglycolate phosphatase-like HAD superfamily hydrolase
MPLPQIIFDLDSTLIASLRPSVRHTLKIARARGWPADERIYRHLLSTWGRPTEMMIPDAWQGLITAKGLEAIWRIFNKTRLSPPYRRVRQTLQVLSSLGIEMHIFTDRGLEGTVRHLGHGRIRRHFRRVVTRDDTSGFKPFNDGAELIIKPYEALGHSRAGFLYVGDGIYSDFPCAREAGVEFLGVAQEPNATRAGFRDAGVPKTHIIDRITDLPAWLGWRYGI